MKWYVVHTYASHDFKIREAIERGIQETELQDKIGQILIPTQKTFHIRDGKKVEREKKLFNSYIIIQAELTPEVYSYILGMPGVTNFLGSKKKPQPLSENEVNKLKQTLGEEQTLSDSEKLLEVCNELSVREAELERLFLRWSELEEKQS